MPAPESFLEPEVRCDYQVSADMKQIWKVELDMFEEFVRICDKYQLNYQGIAGTLLGAVRHHGFIPWDDDIDIGMPRKDYDRFVEVVGKELPPHLFAQTTLSEREYIYGFTKIRNTNTSAIESARVKYHNTTHQGIFLDIFPMDEVPEDMAYRKRKALVYRLKRALMQGISRQYKSKIIKKCALFLQKVVTKTYVGLCGGWEGAYNNLEDTFRKITIKEGTKTISWLGTWGSIHGSFTRCAWPSADINGELIEVPFEYLKMKIPKNYDAILTYSYKDWHKFVIGQTEHLILEYAPGRPYKDLLVEKYGYKYEEFAR